MQFDPYPLDDLGPNISGGRPIDFIQPRNEVARARQYRNGERALSAGAPAAIGVPAVVVPTVPTTPPATPLY